MSLFASSSSFMDPRERMRLAKMAMMADEDREDRARKSRRRSRRESEVLEDLRWEAGASTSTSSSSSPKPHSSILRRPSSPRIIISPPGSQFDINDLSAESSNSSRRSSRVRFSDVDLPSAKSNPIPATSLPPRSDSIDCVLTSPKPVSDSPHSSYGRSSLPAIESHPLRQSMLSQSSISLPASPKLQQIEPQSSIDTPGDDLLTAQLSYTIPESCRSSYTSEQFAFVSNQSLQEQEDEDSYFTPQPLAYPKFPDALSRFSVSSCSSDAELSACFMRNLSVSTCSTEPEQFLEDESNHHRDSFADLSTPSSGSFSSPTLIRPQMSFPKDSFTSISSPEYRPSLGSPRDSFNSFASSVEYMSESSSQSFRGPTKEDVEAAGAAYNAVFGAKRNSSEVVVAINRQHYVEDLGLSPRSGPSPVMDDEAVMPIQDIPLLDERPRFDSIDYLPQQTSSRVLTSSSHTRESSDSTICFESGLIFPLPPSRICTPVESDLAEEGSELEIESPPELVHHDSNDSVESVQLGTPKLLSTTSLPLPDGLRNDDERSEGQNTVVLPSTASFENLDNLKELNESVLGEVSSPIFEKETPTRNLVSTEEFPTVPAFSNTRIDTSSGWSGSESEEETWIETLRSISLRKHSSPRSNRSISPCERSVTPTPTKSEIRSIPMSENSNRFSNASIRTISSISSMTSAETITTESDMSTHLMTPKSLHGFRRIDSTDTMSLRHSTLRDVWTSGEEDESEEMINFDDLELIKSGMQSTISRGTSNSLPVPTRLRNYDFEVWGPPEILDDYDIERQTKGLENSRLRSGETSMSMRYRHSRSDSNSTINLNDLKYINSFKGIQNTETYSQGRGSIKPIMGLGLEGMTNPSSSSNNDNGYGGWIFDERFEGLAESDDFGIENEYQNEYEVEKEIESGDHKKTNQDVLKSTTTPAKLLVSKLMSRKQLSIPLQKKSLLKVPSTGRFSMGVGVGVGVKS